MRRTNKLREYCRSAAIGYAAGLVVLALLVVTMVLSAT